MSSNQRKAETLGSLSGGCSSEEEQQPVKLLARWQNPAFTPYALRAKKKR